MDFDIHIQQFMTYMKEEKKTAENTILSYERDLNKLKKFFQQQNIEKPDMVTITNLNSYILHLEKQRLAPSTISRNIASIKSFYQFLIHTGKVSKDVSEELRAPRVEKKQSHYLRKQDMDWLFEQIHSQQFKAMRDEAILRLMYDTGIRVSELSGLKTEDVNLTMGYIFCKEMQEKVLPINNETSQALQAYIMEYERMQREKQKEVSAYLFSNQNGGKLTRQGIWKMLKSYESKLHLNVELTPDLIHHSYVVNQGSLGYLSLQLK